MHMLFFEKIYQSSIIWLLNPWLDFAFKFNCFVETKEKRMHSGLTKYLYVYIHMFIVDTVEY